VLEAIAQGRTISDNIRKAVHFLVSSNLSEILIVFGAVALGGGSPLSPLQLLWLNLLTDILPAIGLAEEPGEPGVMQRPPRDPVAPLVNRADLLQFAREAAVLAGGSLGAWAYGTARYGGGARAGTIAFDTAVAGQVLHALLCRSARGTVLGRRAPPNPSLAAGLAGAAALQVLAHLVPGLRRMLDLAPLGPIDLLAIAAGAGLPLLINDLDRRQMNAATSASAERSTSFSTTLPMMRSAMPSTAGVAVPP
jgi:Ca2+-transporting ATPase